MQMKFGQIYLIAIPRRFIQYTNVKSDTRSVQSEYGSFYIFQNRKSGYSELLCSEGRIILVPD